MTATTSRAIANALLMSAGAAAAYVVVTTPSLRRLALRATRVWLGGGLPAFLAHEVHRAWVESARPA